MIGGPKRDRLIFCHSKCNFFVSRTKHGQFSKHHVAGIFYEIVNATYIAIIEIVNKTFMNFGISKTQINTGFIRRYAGGVLLIRAKYSQNTSNIYFNTVQNQINTDFLLICIWPDRRLFIFRICVVNIYLRSLFFMFFLNSSVVFNCSVHILMA